MPACRFVTFARGLLYRRGVFWSVLGAGTLAAIGAGLFYFHPKDQAEQQALDNNYVSSGFVWLTALRRTADSTESFDVRATVYVHANAPSSKLALKIVGVVAAPPNGADPTFHFEAGTVGEPQVLDFPADKLGESIVTCLSLPHPRSGEMIRITQVLVPRVLSGEGNMSRVEFDKAAPEKLDAEQGQPCTGAAAGVK